ncbi:diguanylate cyclase regulator RdcB family protein [Saccharibacillus sp. O23]|uniref:diguanylate cyclase regulator RdcB family protein n=1 Tax=Saccharibacillus sp. O23 TaxID=2009338 RepID=UPI0015C5BD1E|nr:diguanylate cyclase regulator RdcB family protein [Saccharibacillus sp. O23]
MSKQNQNDTQLRDQLMSEIPVLADKQLIDLVNGLEVAQDHIRFRKKRNENWAHRMWDTLIGDSARRQDAIDLNLVEGMKSINAWLEYLQKEKINTDRAIHYVANKLVETRQGVTKLIDRHVELKREVMVVEDRLEKLEKMLDQQVDALNERIDHIGSRQSAFIQLEDQMTKWLGGAYDRFQPITQFLIVIETLNFGSFGIYTDKNSEFEEMFVYKSSLVLQERFRINVNQLVPTEVWLNMLTKENEQHAKMIELLICDEMNSVNKQPVQQEILKRICVGADKQILESQFFSSNKLPKVLTSKRLAERLVSESKIRLEGGGFLASGI